jgi:hypothetical protein
LSTHHPLALTTQLNARLSAHSSLQSNSFIRAQKSSEKTLSTMPNHKPIWEIVHLLPTR